MKQFWLITGFLIIAVATIATACSTEGIELAEMRKLDAKARAESAPYAGEVSVINAQTDATLEKLSLISKLSKEDRLFDAQMGRNEFATIVLEFRALELSIQEEVEAARQVTAELEEATENADGIGHNAQAAANNTWVMTWVLAVFGTLLLGLCVTVIVFAAQFEKRLSHIGR